MRILLNLFLLIASVQGSTYQYVRECLESANPYTSFNTVENLMENVDMCLSRAYISFPGEYREEFKLRIMGCIDLIRETDRSKPEYHDLQKRVAELTSNTGDSIIETGHVISQLAVCTAALKVVTAIDVYEEARFDSIAEHFVHQLSDTDECIEQSMDHIKEHVDLVDERLKEYRLKYSEWVNLTKFRQNAAEDCHDEFDKFIEKIARHIQRQ